MYCLGLHTQNPGLIKVNLEPSPKRGSDKISQLIPKRKNTTESKFYSTVCTHSKNPALREVNLEPRAKRGTDRTEALVSVYWPSQSLHLKQSFSRISCKIILVDSIKVLRQNLMENNLGRLYEIVLNLKRDQPNSQTSCSWAYQSQLFKNYQFNQCLWLGL